MSPKYAAEQGSNRWYTVGPPVIPETVNAPSVTTILSNGMPAFALKVWGENQIRERAVENRAWLATISETEANEFLRDHPDAIMRAAGDRGTDVHALAEKVVLGQDLGGFEEMYPVQVQAVRDWMEAFNVEVVRAEATVINPGPFGYGGTLDFVAVVDGVMTLGDFKTSKGIYPKTALQCAAYARAKYILTPDGQSHSLTADLGIEQVGVLHLTPTGYKWHVSPVAIDDLFATFCAVHAVAMFELEGSKGAISRAIDPKILPAYREELRARVAQLIEWGGAEDLATNWPQVVPTFRQMRDAGAEHNTHQLDAIEMLVRRMEPRHRPPDPVGSRERHDAYIDALTELPADIMLIVQSYAVAGGVPNLRNYNATEPQLDQLDRIITVITCDPDAESRTARLGRATKGRTVNPAELTADEVTKFLRTRKSTKPTEKE